MRKLVITLSLLLCSFQAVAANNALSEIEFQGKKYRLTLSNSLLLALSDNQKYKGTLDKRLGNFSQWTFRLNNQDVGFEVILNEKNKKVINLKNNLDAGGPFLEAISPDSEFVVFDYGTGPSLRDFEIRTIEGKVLLKDSYLKHLTWTKNGLEYALPKTLPIGLNAKTKACEQMGAAYEVQLYNFNGKQKKKINKPPTIECGI